MNVSYYQDMIAVHIAHDASTYTMNNYQDTTLKEILKDITIRCIKCHSKMIRVRDLYDDTLVGYSCQDCPHYNLLNDNPI